MAAYFRLRAAIHAISRKHESARHRHPENRHSRPARQGDRGRLRSLGVAGVATVRQGKVFDIELEGADPTKAEALLKEAADKLLANTVIENYRVEVVG